MWPASRTNNKEAFHCDPNPIGPIASNPDPNAVQLTLEFESWTHPIIFPNDVLETNAAHMPRYNITYAFQLYWLIWFCRTTTRSSYEIGISVIAKALNRNEAMVMVSDFLIICFHIHELI